MSLSAILTLQFWGSLFRRSPTTDVGGVKNVIVERGKAVVGQSVAPSFVRSIRKEKRPFLKVCAGPVGLLTNRKAEKEGGGGGNPVPRGRFFFFIVSRADREVCEAKTASSLSVWADIPHAAFQTI